MKEMQSERAKVSKLRIQLEQASTRMEQEKAAWERQKVHVAMFYNTTTSSRFVHVGFFSSSKHCKLSYITVLVVFCLRHSFSCKLQLQWESLVTCSSNTLHMKYCKVCLAVVKQTDLTFEGKLIFSDAIMVNFDCLEAGLHGAHRQRRLPPGSVRRRLTASA